MKRCPDEATLQAYLDGELTAEAARETAAHLGGCEACAAALGEVESETAFFASAFAPDESLSVPTATLRARVDAAVARLEPANESDTRGRSGGWSFGALLASLPGLLTFTPQRAAAFAGVAAVAVLFFSVFFIDRQGREQGGKSVEVATAGGNGPGKAAAPASASSPETANNPGASNRTDSGGGNKGVRDEDDNENAGAPGRRAARGAGRKGRTPFTPVPAKKLAPEMRQQLAPGEREYQTVIAALDETIKSGESVLKPKVIADYERNIAVLDRAIEETRRVALRNPKDKDAVNFLRSAYQSKIELMTTVADSAQVATLDRD